MPVDNWSTAVDKAGGGVDEPARVVDPGAVSVGLSVNGPGWQFHNI